MKDWQARVRVERDELAARADKLCTFMDGNVYPTLGSVERAALTAQANTMADYHRILTERVARFR